MIAEEIDDFSRLQVKKLTLENLLYLIWMEPNANKDQHLKGMSNYRILRQPIAERFNYLAYPSNDLKQTDFILSPYKEENLKKC